MDCWQNVDVPAVFTVMDTLLRARRLATTSIVENAYVNVIETSIVVVVNVSTSLSLHTLQPVPVCEDEKAKRMMLD